MQRESLRRAWRPRSSPWTSSNEVAWTGTMSWSHPRSRWNLCAAGEPVAVGAEFQPELVVVNPEIAVAAVRHGVRHYRLHLLRNHAYIGLVAPEIAEAVVTE